MFVLTFLIQHFSSSTRRYSFFFQAEDGIRGLVRTRGHGDVYKSQYYATPVYNRFLAWAGFDEAAEGINEGWAAKDRQKTAGAMSDALIDEIAVIGSAEECRARLQADMNTGIHTQIIAPLAGASEADIQRTLEALSLIHIGSCRRIERSPVPPSAAQHTSTCRLYTSTAAEEQK